ncbi:MAG: YggS family pyridoxal phosphate-dependent enzyme [Pseudomonadales bacterium]
MPPITDNIAKLRRRIGICAKKNHRNPEQITLLAVSKTRPAADIEAAYHCGQRDFGENYLQEAEEKILFLKQLPLNWHFIGPIQSNKTRIVASLFDWVHSVDRLKIAQRLNDQRPEASPRLNICLQVNISGEDSKSGVDVQQVAQLAEDVAKLPRLQLRGLMAIPSPSHNSQQQHAAFAQLRQLLEQLKNGIPYLDTLSMGMSGDMEAAIDEGATIVRIGTDIFGPRIARPSTLNKDNT